MKSVITRKTMLIVLEVVFFATLVVTATLNQRIQALMTNDFVLIVFSSLSVFRAARTISFNDVMEWLREPFCVVKADSCGAGADVHPRDDRGSHIETIGSLLSCPICTGTWVSLIFFVIWTVVPNVGHGIFFVLGLAGASELIHYVTLWFEWGQRLSRVTAGQISPDTE